MLSRVMRIVTSNTVQVDSYTLFPINYNGRSATSKYLSMLGSIHDIESYSGIENRLALNTQVLLSHWSHLSIITL